MAELNLTFLKTNFEQNLEEIKYFKEPIKKLLVDIKNLNQQLIELKAANVNFLVDKESTKLSNEIKKTSNEIYDVSDNYDNFITGEEALKEKFESNLVLKKTGQVIKDKADEPERIFESTEGTILNLKQNIKYYTTQINNLSNKIKDAKNGVIESVNGEGQTEYTAPEKKKKKFFFFGK
jgi:hypothetical protein